MVGFFKNKLKQFHSNIKSRRKQSKWTIKIGIWQLLDTRDNYRIETIIFFKSSEAVEFINLKIDKA